MNPVILEYTRTRRDWLLAAARECERIAAEYQRIADDFRRMA